MTIEAGATLKFDTGKELEVNGTLDVNGTVGERAIFAASSSSWGGIEFTSGSAGSVSYANISGAGIAVSNADISIDHSTLSGSTGTGINVTGSSSDVDVSYTVISGYSEGLSYTSTSSGHLSHSAIVVSGTAFAASYYADPYIAPYPYNNGGDNDLLGDWRTVAGYYGSTIWGGSAGYYGYNYICDGASSYDALEDATSTVTLVGNYWPSSRDVYGGVDATSDQGSSSSNCPPSAGKGFGTILAEQVAVGDYRLLSANNLMFQAALGGDQPTVSMLHRAADILKEIRADRSGEADAVAALVALFRLARLQDTAEQLPYFEQLASVAGPEQASALGILIQAYLHWGNNDRARQTATLLSQQYPNQWHSFYAGLSVFEMDYAAGDYSAAAAGLLRLVPSDMSELDRLDSAWERVVRKSKGAIERPTLPSLPTARKGATPPEVIAEVAAYPNPFNPSTIVTFDLAASSQAEIKVYDTLGCVVAVLAQEPFQPGWHSIEWDGSASPSGVYFVVIRAGGLTKTLPITLVR